MSLAYPALVLNADFTPVSVFPLSVWSFEHTMRKTLTGKVSVIETHDAVLRGQNYEYRPPSVVALKRYVHKAPMAKFNRVNIFVRDGFQCQYCAKKFSARELTFDHVIPRAAGGTTCWTNIATACISCNARKGHRTDIKPIRKPRQPTIYELAKLQPPDISRLHQNAMDYLYWMTPLNEDE